MRILQVNKFHYIKGGAERHYFDLSELLEKNGHKVIHFAMQHPENVDSPFSKYFVSNVDISKPRYTWSGLKAAGRIFYSFEAKRKVEQLMQAEKPELVHIHNIYHQISPSILPIFKKHKLPIVMTVHDWKLLCPNYLMFAKGAVCERCKKYRYWNAAIHRCVKNSFCASALSAGEMWFHKWRGYYEKYVDVYITPSQFVKNKMVEWGYSADKIVVLPHFIIAHTIARAIARAMVCATARAFILYFGRLSREKGVDALINAMQNVPNDVKLKIVGAGPEEGKSKVKSQKLKTEVEFLGHKKGEDLWNLVSQAKFVIVPSIWYEVFGLNILEAFQCGAPVIASDIGAIPELVKDNETGLLVEPGQDRDLAEKITWLWERPDEAARMGENARKFVHVRFTQGRYYEELMKIYGWVKRLKN